MLFLTQANVLVSDGVLSRHFVMGRFERGRHGVSCAFVRFFFAFSDTRRIHIDGGHSCEIAFLS